ncbi:Beta-lactamase domain protein [uncultured Pleomorphomonas sp.]|uniref:Beta-lactamase domain protein n=1 Tax=uncultured Pleomorphomonas sp. TaxID=442121 RepID=A0A212LEP4_9HYPH|nr:MBL fold metallo-hydrolase [uncultured Pleomorphomonas sp.]SCM75970.1 Beta-lactamase domain protein [uncultured Pleomorphomonas sp.]
MSRLLAVSGFGAKGPACFLLEIAGRRLLLDLGEGPDFAIRPDLSGIGPVDAVLISHLHHDHTGALDLVSAVGSPPVFATDLTRRLMRASRLPASISSLPMNGRTEVAGLAVETGPAGHAPGAVWMRIGGADGLLYTGDYSGEGRLFPVTPPLLARAMVFDASYGVADVPLAEQVIELETAIGDGPCLLPAPPAGRGLEMALHLMAAGRRVALCPAHRRVAETLIDQDAGPAEAAAALARLLRDSLPLADDTPDQERLPDAVMIAGTADAAGGVAGRLAARIVADGGGRIVFTGHLAAGTPAKILVEEGKAAFCRWNVHPRLAGARALLAAVRPEIVMAAFLEVDGVRRLARALPAENFASTSEFTW